MTRTKTKNHVIRTKTRNHVTKTKIVIKVLLHHLKSIPVAAVLHVAKTKTAIVIVTRIVIHHRNQAAAKVNIVTIKKMKLKRKMILKLKLRKSQIRRQLTHQKKNQPTKLRHRSNGMKLKSNQLIMFRKQVHVIILCHNSAPMKNHLK